MALARKRKWLLIRAGSLVAAVSCLILFGTIDARASDQATQTVAALTLTQELIIDEELKAFDDPVLVRIKARVAPPWRGPLGQPPWTERRNCPQVELFGLDTPPYC